MRGDLWVDLFGKEKKHLTSLQTDNLLQFIKKLDVVYEVKMELMMWVNWCVSLGLMGIVFGLSFDCVWQINCEGSF